MRNTLFLALLGSLLSGGMVVPATASAGLPSVQANAVSTVAAAPDRGSFLAYGGRASITKGASTWHPVDLSELHAINAMTRGGMVVAAPDGRPIRLQFVRQIVHPDGNWTWVGRPVGSGPGTEAMFTFGRKAVFGTIPNGKSLPLELTTMGGHAWIVETDQRQLVAEGVAASGSDALPGPSGSSSAQMATASTAAASNTTRGPDRTHAARVDLVLGYTTAFATRLGGQSQAVTRLNFIVDIANQAYVNSGVNGKVMLVKTLQVDYPDNTQNRATLYALSGLTCTATTSTGQHYLPDMGVNCTAAAVPTALQPLLTARQQYGADLVSLVRNYTVPENQTCGVAWLLGGAQHAIDASSAAFGLSVVSDSSGSQFPSNGSTCRNETLAHELGHNMGLAHDQAAAAGTDDSNSDGNLLDPEEYGRFSDSFGYKTGVGAGNFYDIMGVPDPGQTSYRVFSSPLISTCGGQACGVAGQADNARTLNLTMPMVSALRNPPPAVLSPKQLPHGG
jgi:hypothetical protein